jgi:hypothetical protein
MFLATNSDVDSGLTEIDLDEAYALIQLSKFTAVESAIKAARNPTTCDLSVQNVRPINSQPYMLVCLLAASNVPKSLFAQAQKKIVETCKVFVNLLRRRRKGNINDFLPK